jgi:hypothetical protein
MIRGYAISKYSLVCYAYCNNINTLNTLNTLTEIMRK